MPCWIKPMVPLVPCFAFESGTKKGFRRGHRYSILVKNIFDYGSQLEIEFALQSGIHTHMQKTTRIHTYVYVHVHVYVYYVMCV